MLSDVPQFLHDVFLNWANLFWIWTVIPDALSWWRRDDMAVTTVGGYLDQWVEPSKRHWFYRVLFVGGLLLATFFAWDEQYQAAITKSPEVLNQQITNLQNTIAPLQRYKTEHDAREWPDIDEKAFAEDLKKRQGDFALFVDAPDGCNDCDRLKDHIENAAFGPARMGQAGAAFICPNPQREGIRICAEQQGKVAAQLVADALNTALNIKSLQPMIMGGSSGNPTDVNVYIGLRTPSAGQ